MMRLGRTASPLVALYMLISAATADAECAWVWEITASSAPKTTTEPVALTPRSRSVTVRLPLRSIRLRPHQDSFGRTRHTKRLT
jgi:hypothetical protein